MKSDFKSIKGVRDWGEADCRSWQYVVNCMSSTLNNIGFEQIILQTLEYKTLFTRTLGITSDIVDKQMYEFADLVLRPEGTASAVRFVIENHFQKTRNKKLEKKIYYCGPMFRRERPQKERYREFYQLGIESMCTEANKTIQELEIILIVNKIFQILGIKVTIKINNIGNKTERSLFAKDFIKHISCFKHQLTEIQKNTLNLNPIRLLDSKDKKIQDICSTGPVITEYVDNTQFNQLCKNITNCNLIKDHKLVRGLDYYSGTVFEYYADSLNTAICSGGRYDSLLQKHKVSCFGCAFGIDRIVYVLNNLDKIIKKYNSIDIFICGISDPQKYNNLLNKLVTDKFRLFTSMLDVSLKKHLKQAFVKQAKYLLYFSMQDKFEVYLVKNKSKVLTSCKIQEIFAYLTSSLLKT